MADRYLLESSSVDGYLLEDGSGVLLLDGLNSYTLAADSASFTLTGSAANLRKGVTLAAASAAFTLSGTAATLKVARTISAASAAFTLTGTAATLRKGFSLTAASASYSLTGTAATFRLGRLLSAASAAFVLTGTAASLKVGRKVTAASASFVLIGSDATLTKSGTAPVLVADPAAFTLTGSDATLTKSSSTTALHGRKPRGKRVIFPEELPPAPIEPVPVIEPLPSLAQARIALVEARTALKAVQNARIEAAEREERQRVIDSLSAELNAAQARYDAAREAEARIVRRLRDEDELFLLAA